MGRLFNAKEQRRKGAKWHDSGTLIGANRTLICRTEKGERRTSNFQLPTDV
jgi:hypothetical protein